MTIGVSSSVAWVFPPATYRELYGIILMIIGVSSSVAWAFPPAPYRELNEKPFDCAQGDKGARYGQYTSVSSSVAWAFPPAMYREL